MADEDLLPFDPTMKKKKKKKKTGFDLDAAMGDDSTATDGQPSAPAPPAPEEEPEPEQEVQTSQDKVSDDISLDFTNMKKKKKKKKTTFDLEEIGDALPETTENESKEPPTAAIDDDFGDLDFTKKKKKKKKVVTMGGGVDDVQGEDNGDLGLGDEITGSSWVGTDRDYTYDELLTRVFEIMREKNPDIMAGEKKKFVMRPPQVLRVGTRKTSFANFSDICRLLHRQPKHVLAFLLSELGTSGSVDGNNQLIIRGKYTQKQIENVLRRYIKEYVTCHTCRSRETILQKDTRLFFLQCETCGSRCSVASIKTGFQAITGKRAAIRQKTA